MPRLIDADALLMDNTWAFYDRFGNRTSAGLAIEEAPTVDAEPVRHGHWLTSPTGWLYCSECEGEPPCEINVRTDYCPNCGAKMDEVEERITMPTPYDSPISADYLAEMRKEDAETVVRCKDCKYLEEDECPWTGVIDWNGYCSKGERREDAETEADRNGFVK